MPRKCQCGIVPSFGNPGGKPTCCKRCKTDDMTIVRNKTCTCGKQPVFGVPGGKPTHCSGCKEVGMEDVKNKKCPCGKQPVFGVPGGKPTHCSGCKEVGMEDVKNKKCPCGNRAYFGILGQNPTHCRVCKENGMENFVAKRCQGCNGENCPTGYFISPGREYCLACDPDDSRKLARKRDEAAFFNFLNKHIVITQREFPVHYRCIDTNKTMAFIDGIIITKDIVICLELDEDAHEVYDQGCEEARMHNVSAELKIAFPNHNVAWVRVNPHTKKNGKRDVSSRAKKIRDQRYKEALEIIEDILQKPKDCIEYIGYG
ncbi:hypothetical protein ATCVNTS1_466L [Acanthocystis turfacea Chlorella virus NTS-1]|nr:hypothetical protein ATCVNTS1_466L [Acanthocystis turfacea Chlorella virus NTS-1]AGE59423.1 hypothetical protein ATCVOR07043_439L [Acanthocystis turfacea Chlorella virus OR0704.3]